MNLGTEDPGEDFLIFRRTKLNLEIDVVFKCYKYSILNDCFLLIQHVHSERHENNGVFK